MQKILFVIFVLVISSPVFSGETIATNTWELEAPQNWKINYETEPAQLHGPAGEVVLLTSKDLPLTDSSPEANSYRDKLEKMALKVMHENAQEPPMTPEAAISSVDLSDKVRLHQVISSSAEDQSTLAQFCIIGPRALLLITYDSAGTQDSLTEIVNSLVSIKWAL